MQKGSVVGRSGPRSEVSRSLADRRRELGLSQTLVAAKMGASQSALARLEGGESDPRISTLERYALVMGSELELRTDGD